MSKLEHDDERLQKAWKELVSSELGSLDHYTNVAVLMVHWIGSLDEDLKAHSEVAPLAKIFREDFGYGTKVVQLDNKVTPPQLQLDQAIKDLADGYDGPCRTDLLIVYYTGHGYYGNGRGKLDRRNV
ncbi:hypothetical protein B0A55_01561 [Friedmanniomyces simplex]|uniref:Caspase family protein n=1 Tax=Friedmanniomyces simplex TaxID=329884 RepID=A0A4U0Y2J7_9PEZI|nr:hypothetical protein B0A55_01561 [Friedmanniomyces simplex]